jgi:glycosyltransferase involved in cell wall biosynthesis
MANRILIVSHEALGPLLSGPAIRCWELAHALAAEHSVTLAVPAPVERDSQQVRLVGYDVRSGEALRAELDACEAVVASGYLLRHYPFLAAGPPLVVDLYDPFMLENLAIHAGKPLADQQALYRIDRSVLDEQLRMGDFFLCASEQQRDFWIGMLAASGRVNPLTVQADMSLRRLIAVVPFGLPAGPPVRRQAALKGVIPGIGPDDRLVYWGGGLWDWFDPQTAIRAVAALSARVPNVRLFFAGVHHPNPAVPPMRPAEAAQALSADLGLTGRHVFFNDWVPYDRRADYLLEADAAVSFHLDHIETRFAFRTRYLDYLWASLPMVLTRGDSLGEQAASYGLARLVSPGDVTGAAQALAEALAESRQTAADCRERARPLLEALRWPRVVAPLNEFCRAPQRAADKADAVGHPRVRISLLPKAWQSLRARGPAGLLRDIRLYLGR